jgi:hypothetical protein
MRLIKPLSSGKRNNRGLSLPGCGLGVSVPISIKPKPKAESSSNSIASLSKPAARPTGLGNLIPKTSRSRLFPFGLCKAATMLFTNGIAKAIFIKRKVK